jgi:hypothetical protein
MARDGDQRQWALPTTPEARIVELLLRELGEDLPPTARDVLREQQVAFESDDAGAKVGESAWTRVSQALSGDDLRQSAGSEAVLQVRHALEAAKLRRI